MSPSLHRHPSLSLKNYFAPPHLWAHLFCNIHPKVALVVNNPPANTGDIRDESLIPGLGRSSGGGQPTPVFLLGETQGQRSLADYSPWSLIELDTTEATETLSFFSSFALFLLCLLNRSLPFHLCSSLSFLPFPSLDFPFRLAPAVSLSSHMTSGFSSTWVSYLFLSPWHVSLLGVYPCIFW